MKDLLEKTLDVLVEQDTEKIKVEHPGILEIPKTKKFWDMPLRHYLSLGNKKGKGAVMKALLNLERWNKKEEPKVSKAARNIIDHLKINKEWEDIN